MLSIVLKQHRHEGTPKIWARGHEGTRARQHGRHEGTPKIWARGHEGTRARQHGRHEGTPKIRARGHEGTRARGHANIDGTRARRKFGHAGTRARGHANIEGTRARRNFGHEGTRRLKGTQGTQGTQGTRFNRHFETASCEHSTMMKSEHFSTLLDRDRSILSFSGCRYITLASKSCNEFFTIKFPTVFKLCRDRVNASSNFATVTFFHRFQSVPASCERSLSSVAKTKTVPLWMSRRRKGEKLS